MKATLKIALAGVSCFAMTQAASAQTLDYGLYEELFGEPVTTSATGKPQRKSDVPLNMEIITQSQIKRSGARDIPQILRRYAGLSVHEFSIASSEVGIRGYNQPFAERILVLVNGRQVYLEYFGIVIWSLIGVELSEIRQIEVIRGPNTALFGFNAVSGVINIVTDNPLYTQKTTVTAGYGSQNQRFASLTSSFKINEMIGVRISAGLGGMDEFDTQGPLAFNRDTVILDPRRRHVTGEIYAQLTDSIQATLEGSYTDIDQNGFSPLRIEAKAQSKLKVIRARIIAETGIGQININGYINDTDPLFQLPTPGPNLNSIRPFNKSTILQVSDLFKVGTNHTFRISGEYRNSDFQFRGLDFSPLDGGGDLQYNIYSAAGLWDWAIQDNLTLSTAMRYDLLKLDRSGGFPGGFPFSNDDYNRTIKEVGLNAGLVWKVSEEDTLRFTIARGVDIPSLVEFGLVFPVAPSPFGGAVFVTGDPDTNTSPVWNYEIDWDKRLDSISSNMRIAVFYQTVKDLQAFNAGQVIAPPNILNLLGNIGDSEVFGFEVSLDGENDDTFWLLNYSYIDVTDDRTVNNGPVTTSPYLGEEEASTHTFNVNVGHTFGKFTVDTLLHYTSSYQTSRNLFLPPPGSFQRFDVSSNFRVDLRLAYKVNDSVELEVVGQSIFDNNFFESSQAPVQRQVFFRIQTSF